MKGEGKGRGRERVEVGMRFWSGDDALGYVWAHVLGLKVVEVLHDLLAGPLRA